MTNRVRLGNVVNKNAAVCADSDANMNSHTHSHAHAHTDNDTVNDDYINYFASTNENDTAAADADDSTSYNQVRCDIVKILKRVPFDSMNDVKDDTTKYNEKKQRQP